MKRNLLAALLVALVALMAVSPAMAYNSIQVLVTDGNGSPWTLGGTFTVSYFDISGAVIVSCVTTHPAGISPYNYDLSNCSGLEVGDPVWGTFDPNATSGNVSAVNFSFVQNSSTDTIVFSQSTGTGPTAVILSDFSASARNGNWLPWVLLVGSVVLLGGGAAAILRKRK